jgi:hypothetical protein
MRAESFSFASLGLVCLARFSSPLHTTSPAASSFGHQQYTPIDYLKVL